MLKDKINKKLSKLESTKQIRDPSYARHRIQ
jgi:hypothetical protein